MNYQSTLIALKNKYPSTYNNVLLCLFKKYYPAITSSIMDQLKIDSSSLKECPVIYNDLGIPDGFNADDPIEISPMFLQRYVDSLIMKYNMIDDRYKKRKHLHTILKPMLIKGASPDFTDEDIEDKPVDPEEFYNRNKDYINDLLVKIYNNSSELETLKLSNEEMQLVNFIDMYYFGLSNAFYFSDLLKNIYNELLRIIKEKNTFIEECYYIFKNILYSKIKSKQYPTNKIDNIERDYKILPTNLKQSYKRKNNMKKIRLKEYYPINNSDELKDFINNSTIQNKVFYARSLPQDFLDYVKYTLNVKLFDSRVIEVIYNEQLYDIPDENERINTEPKKNILIIGKVLSNKENLEGRKVFIFLKWGHITRYSISNDTPEEIKDMIETIQLSEIEEELISKIDSITRYNNEDKSIRGLKKSYNIESYKRKNNIQLKNYKEQKVSNMSFNKHLQIKLNISPREAQIIESVAKEYLLEEVDYKPAFINFMKSNLNDFKSELIDFVRVGPALKYWEINITVKPDILDMLQGISNIFKTKNKRVIFIDNKIKLNQSNIIKFDWLNFVDFLVNPKNDSNFLDKASFDEIKFDVNTKYALYNCFGSPIGNLEGYDPSEGRLKKDDPSEGRLKKETNLKNYLHKRLTISEKEATLIESAVRQYVQKSKGKK